MYNNVNNKTRRWLVHMEFTEEYEFEAELESELIVLEKEITEYENARKWIYSSDVNDLLKAFCMTKVLNALGGKRELLFNKIIHLITGDIELTELNTMHYDFDKRWYYRIGNGYSDILKVDAKEMTIELEVMQLMRAYNDWNENPAVIETTEWLNLKWLNEIEEVKPKGLKKISKQKILNSVASEIRRDINYETRKEKKITADKWSAIAIPEKLERLNSEIQRVIKAYESKGFKVIYPESANEHYAIKTYINVLEVKRTKEQKTLWNMMNSESLEKNINDSDFPGYSGFGTTGPFTHFKEVYLYQDNVNSDGYTKSERMLEKRELRELAEILKMQTTNYVKPTIYLNGNGEGLEFEHLFLPIKYSIYPNGKIFIEKMDNKNNPYPFYSHLGMRTLIDIPGFKNWFNKLSVFHYTKYQD